MLKAYPPEALEYHLPHFKVDYRIALECVNRKQNRFGNREANKEWEQMNAVHRDIRSLSFAYLVDYDPTFVKMSDKEMKFRG